MTVLSVDVSEIADLVADLAATGDLVDPAAAASTRRAAEATVLDAKALAPVETGALRDSITATVDGMSAEVGPTVDYGVFVEYGTSVMAPEPYLGPAYEKNAERYVEDAEKIADRVLG